MHHLMEGGIQIIPFGLFITRANFPQGKGNNGSSGDFKGSSLIKTHKKSPIQLRGA
jgi:hypothetical protein